MIATSVEQSKRLIELGLDPDTADMCYGAVFGKKVEYWNIPKAYKADRESGDMPCWSLSALIGLTNVCDRYELHLRSDKTWNVFATCEGKVFRSFDINNKGFKTIFDAAYNTLLWCLNVGVVVKADTLSVEPNRDVVSLVGK